MEDYSIRPITLGTIDVPKVFLTNQYGYGELVREGCFSWYIEGPSKRILVDTGSRMQLLRFPAWEHQISFEQRLKDFGLKPADIDIVILTHLHYEHCGYCALFPNAKFYVQKTEYEFALNPHPSYAHFYDKRQLENVNLELVEGDQEIVKGVRTMFTPGHCIGAQSVLVETSQGIAGITGFCCIAQNFEPPVALNTRDNIINIGMYYDPIAAYDNMLKFRDACDILIPIHDPSFINVDRIPKPNVTYTPDHKIR
ncbi:N-acyl homoserine lactonase family protein [Chloroflexota bacterium]